MCDNEIINFSIRLSNTNTTRKQKLERGLLINWFIQFLFINWKICEMNDSVKAFLKKKINF